MNHWMAPPYVRVRWGMQLWDHTNQKEQTKERYSYGTDKVELSGCIIVVGGLG